MKPFILIEGSNIDLFVETKVLKYSGAVELFTFNKVKDALCFLKDNNLNEAVFLVDLNTLLDAELEDFDFVSKLHKQKNNIVVYLLVVLPPLAQSSISLITDFANGIIDKPLTIDKMGMVVKDVYTSKIG